MTAGSNGIAKDLRLPPIHSEVDRSCRPQTSAPCSALQCPLCGNVLENPAIIGNCLHRFCDGCLKKHTSISGPRCPSCFKAFTQEDVSPDHLFQRILNSKILKVNSGTVDGSSRLSPVNASCPSIANKIKRRLRDVHFENEVCLVLWPDASVKRQGFPKAASRIRYIIMDGSTTVAHLSEFVLTRTELESDWTEKDLYVVEFTPVIAEQSNFLVCQLPPTAVFLRPRSNRRASQYGVTVSPSVPSDSNDDFLAKGFALPNQMLSVRYPIRPIPMERTVLQLREEYHKDPSQTLKLMFRLVPATNHKNPVASPSANLPTNSGNVLNPHNL